MNSGLYYFLIASGIILSVAGASLIGLMFYKRNDAISAAPVGIVEKLNAHRTACNIAGSVMLVSGIASLGSAMYFGPSSNKMSLRGY